ncbi:hypothetical protein ElyMa_004570000 [Elysia marginata]|uniref:Uncharacterized protein n=1 Tax=Elysia marginata TaxID=1093978 RepID=A0AAV4HWR9_9GAST|nr:hypothetical protein ElyMa_004570000 [Elysia marginata]
MEGIRDPNGKLTEWISGRRETNNAHEGHTKNDATAKGAVMEPETIMAREEDTDNASETEESDDRANIANHQRGRYQPRKTKIKRVQPNEE